MIVTTRKVPFRLSLRDRRPIVIEITVKNNTSREKRYVVRVETDSNLSLSPSGLARYSEVKMGVVYPGEKAVAAIKIFPRTTTKPGEYKVSVVVDECLDSYEHVVSSKPLEIRVPVI